MRVKLNRNSEQTETEGLRGTTKLMIILCGFVTKQRKKTNFHIIHNHLIYCSFENCAALSLAGWWLLLYHLCPVKTVLYRSPNSGYLRENWYWISCALFNTTYSSFQYFWFFGASNKSVGGPKMTLCWETLSFSGYDKVTETTDDERFACCVLNLLDMNM